MHVGIPEEAMKHLARKLKYLYLCLVKEKKRIIKMENFVCREADKSELCECWKFLGLPTGMALNPCLRIGRIWLHTVMCL